MFKALQKKKKQSLINSCLVNVWKYLFQDKGISASPLFSLLPTPSWKHNKCQLAGAVTLPQWIQRGINDLLLGKLSVRGVLQVLCCGSLSACALTVPSVLPGHTNIMQHVRLSLIKVLMLLAKISVEIQKGVLIKKQKLSS